MGEGGREGGSGGRVSWGRVEGRFSGGGWVGW